VLHNAKHSTSWLCLSPSNKISGGKVLSSRTDDLAAGPRRCCGLLRSPSGAPKPRWELLPTPSSAHRQGQGVTATARKIAILFHNTLRHGMEYSDPGASHYEERYRRRVLTNLERRAKSLGYVLQEAPAPA